MDSVNFNYRLNHSDNIESRYSRFSEYRELLTNECMSVFNEQKIKRVMVLGAGNLCDIDYKKLIEQTQVECIVLTDIDKDSLEEGYSFQQLDVFIKELIQKRNINILIERFNYLGNLHIENLDFEDIHKIVENIRTIEFPTNIVRYTYDLVLCLPIYTQLLFTQLEYYYATDQRWLQYRKIFFGNMIYIIDAFNQNMVSLIKEGGIAFVLSDILEDASTGKYIQKIKPLKNHGSLRKVDLDRHRESIKKTLHEYEKEFGVGLGRYGLINLSEYLSVFHNCFFLWSFDKERVFLVEGNVFIKE